MCNCQDEIEDLRSELLDLITSLRTCQDEIEDLLDLITSLRTDLEHLEDSPVGDPKDNNDDIP